MSKTIELKSGDPCPNCGTGLRVVKLPSDEQRAAAKRAGDEHVPIPYYLDTAPQTVVDDIGRLHKCDVCGFDYRMPSDVDGGAGVGTSAAARKTRG